MKNESVYKHLLKLILIIFLVSFSGCKNNETKSSNSHQVNQKKLIVKNAPEFTGVDSFGNMHKLSDYRGKIVVLEWKNADCPFVKKHYQTNNMQQLQKDAVENGIVWLSIISSAPGKQGHVTGEQANIQVKKESSYATAVLLDANGEIGRLYNAKTTPHMFIINKKGELVYRGAIDSIRSVDSEDINQAINYVKMGLKDLTENKAVTTSETKPYGCSIKY